MDIGLIFCTMVMSLIFLVGGYSLRKTAKRKINHVIGYRTSLSMKNEDTWAFANDELGKIWIKIGWFIVPFTILFNVVFAFVKLNCYEMVCVLFVIGEIVVLFITRAIVESKMRRTFNRDGSRKEELD